MIIVDLKQLHAVSNPVLSLELTPLMGESYYDVDVLEFRYNTSNSVIELHVDDGEVYPVPETLRGLLNSEFGYLDYFGVYHVLIRGGKIPICSSEFSNLLRFWSQWYGSEESSTGFYSSQDPCYFNEEIFGDLNVNSHLVLHLASLTISHSRDRDAVARGYMADGPSSITNCSCQLTDFDFEVLGFLGVRLGSYIFISDIQDLLNYLDRYVG